jgi:hypothetical protein
MIEGKCEKLIEAIYPSLKTRKEGKDVETEQEIRNRLYDLRLRSRERYLELMGIDIPKVREMEKDIDAQYEKLTAEIRDMLKDKGREKAEQHKASLERARGIIHKNIESLVDRQHSIIGREDALLMPKLLAICLYYPFPAPIVGSGDNVTLDPPSGVGASGSVTYNGAASIAHPYAEAWGMGTGTINSAQVKTWFKYAFTPKSDGVYCIHPLVYMNGHWLVWTWGTCGGTPEDLGSGTVRVTLRVRVDQLSTTVKQIEHTVLEQNVSAGMGTQSGFGYDSDVDGGADMSVLLEGGHEAIVWVEAESFARISNHGRAWVDMQTSPFFYFRVDGVYRGPLKVAPIWP